LKNKVHSSNPASSINSIKKTSYDVFFYVSMSVTYPHLDPQDLRAYCGIHTLNNFRSDTILCEPSWYYSRL